MTDPSLDELGSVDYVVVEFPAAASNFTGEMAAELVALVESGTIRVIDVLILTKHEDGTVEAAELSDVGELGQLEAIEAQLAELMAAEDIQHLAAAMDPGSTAGVLQGRDAWPRAGRENRGRGRRRHTRAPSSANLARPAARRAVARGRRRVGGCGPKRTRRDHGVVAARS